MTTLATMTDSALTTPVGLLAVSGTLVTALVAVIPLLAGCWLLLRASGGRGLREASGNDFGSLAQELQDNYERLRRSPEALPLSVAAWSRLRDRLTTLPPSVRQILGQTYRMIEVANHVLTVDAYDHRGGLAVRQRRMALWPTLEAAVRGALKALDVHPTPARQVGPRLVEPARAGVAPAPVVNNFTLERAPRLTVFYAPATAEAAPAAAKSAPVARPRRTAVRSRSHDSQMPLWESVA